MCQWTFLGLLLVLLKSNADVVEESHPFYPPSTVNFHDIYSNSLALLADESSATATGKEDDFHISNMPTQFVEFRPPETTILPSTTTGEVNSIETTDKTESSTTKKSTGSTTTEEPEESSVKVLPIAKNYQRGVLDLLFPANRVRSFKSIFDTFKRVLSHTF